MQSVQRKFGKLMKRSADRSDVGGILSEFNTADQALGSVWRALCSKEFLRVLIGIFI